MTQTTTLPSDTQHQLMLIRGEWISAIDGDVIAIESPRDKTTFADIPRGAAKDVDAAVRGAQDAFPSWRDTPGRQRARAIAIAADCDRGTHRGTLTIAGP